MKNYPKPKHAIALMAMFLIATAVCVVIYQRNHQDSLDHPQYKSAQHQQSEDYYEPTANKPGTKYFTIIINENRIANNITTISVKEGEPVQLTVRSGELQPGAVITIESYNLMTIIAKNTEQVMEFKAAKKGIFPIQIAPEGAKNNLSTATIATLVVE